MEGESHEQQVAPRGEERGRRISVGGREEVVSSVVVLVVDERRGMILRWER